MNVYLKFLRLFLVLMVGVFFLVGSGGGGGGDEKAPENNNTFTNNVEFLSDEIENKITDIVTNESDGGSLIVNDTNKTVAWDKGTIKYLKVNDDLPSGMFIKVIDTKEENDGKKKIIYVTPTVDEVFENLNIDMNDLNLSFTVDKVKMNKNVSLKINNVLLPKGANGRVNKFFPSVPKVTFDSEKGEGWNILKKLSATFNFPIFKSDDNSTTLGLTGKFILDDIRVTDFRFKTYRLAENLGSTNVFLNAISPKTGIDYKFGMAYKAEKEFAIEGKFEKKFSISNFAKGTLFECGLITKKEFADSSISFTSTGYEKSDICLGSIGLGLGYDSKKKSLVPLLDVNAGSGKSALKIGVDIAMILGLDGNIHFVSKLSGKKKSYESFMGQIDTHKLFDDPSKVLNGYSKESAKKGSNEKAKWVYKVSGELSGDITHYVGLAVAVHISNMTPLGIRSYGGIKATAKGEAYYRLNDNKWGGCWDVGLNLLLGADVISKNSLDINITNKKIVKFYDNLNSKFNTELDPNLNLGVNYKLPLGGKPINIVRYNSCESKEYTASFIKEPKSLKDFDKSNIRIEYIGGGTVEPQFIYYFIYDNKRKLISNSNSLSIMEKSEIPKGKYQIETILVVDENKSIKTMIRSEYVKKEPLPEPTNLYFTSDTSALTSGNLIVSFNNANIKASSQDPITSYTYNWGDGQSSTFTTLGNITHTYSTAGNYTVLLTVTTDSGMTYTFSEEISTVPKVEFPLTLNSKTSTHFNLSWTAPTGATKYKLCQSSIDEVSYDTAQTCNNLVDGYFFDVTTSSNMSINSDATGNVLQQDTTYYFRVVAYNDSDEVVGVSSLVSDKLAVVDSVVATSKLKKTGQTRSYDTDGNEVTDGSVKDDGYYKKGITPSYTRDSTKEVVIDNITGLMWQDDIGAKNISKPWVVSDDYSNTTGDTVNNYCSSLLLNDYDDWRVPTMSELQSISNINKDNSSLNIDSIFKNVNINNSYWSSTQYIPDNRYNYSFNMYSGKTSYYLKTSATNIRCVRFNSTTQTIKKLEWQDDYTDNQGNVKILKWNEAIDYCENLELDTYTDWRLPNKNELLSILDYNKEQSPRIDERFKNTISSYYWTSTTIPTDTKSAFVVHFHSGETTRNNHNDEKRYGSYVRCVRDSTKDTSTTSFSYKDEFNDLNTSFWNVVRVDGNWKSNVIDNNAVTFENGIIDLYNDKTDDGPVMYSNPLKIKKGDIVTVKRKAYVHSSNRHLNGALNIMSTNSDTLDVNNVNNLCRISHVNETYQGDWNGFYLDSRSNTDAYITPIWDDWFVEELKYNTKTGEATYTVNDTTVSHTCKALEDEKNILFQIHNFGWYTGHYVKMDYIDIKIQGEE